MQNIPEVKNNIIKYYDFTLYTIYIIYLQFEMLSIFMAGETVRFRFCGLLEWNFRTGASYMTATILYLIVLVQFDYNNL